ncbi:MAG: nitrate/nitrite transporter NrtS [Alphaproteobacteria bacterium]|nr:nitrate/nitrite transporter NrtS [Alphaproteobacteria bacterium]MDE2074889.1 nitrate/nitrite transporter NrtS [Alphaproteobacteria bacterium]
MTANRSSGAHWRAARKTFELPVLRRSVMVTLVVGTILNAINQGTEILGGKPVDVLRLLLTYAVPFFVASYGAYSAFARLETFRD